MMPSKPTLLRTDPENATSNLLGLAQPALIEGGARLMPAFRCWTDSHLLDVLGSQPMIVRFPDGARGRVNGRVFINYLLKPSAYHLARGWMYLTDYYLRPSFGELHRAELASSAAFPLPRDEGAEWTSLYAGPAGTTSEFHQDVFSTCTWLALLRGRKRWTLADPSLPDPRDAADHDRIEFIQESGDLLLLPPDWWHEVENLEATIAVSGNFCSFDHAQRSYAKALRSQSPNRDVWVRTWEEIIRTQAPAR